MTFCAYGYFQEIQDELLRRGSLFLQTFCLLKFWFFDDTIVVLCVTLFCLTLFFGFKFRIKDEKNVTSFIFPYKIWKLEGP
jgi:hypothetical protein